MLFCNFGVLSFILVLEINVIALLTNQLFLVFVTFSVPCLGLLSLPVSCGVCSQSVVHLFIVSPWLVSSSVSCDLVSPLCIQYMAFVFLYFFLSCWMWWLSVCSSFPVVFSYFFSCFSILASTCYPQILHVTFFPQECFCS